MKNLKILSLCAMICAAAINTAALAQTTATFNLETGTGTGDGWTWEDPVLTVNDGANITITGQVDNGRRIEVEEDAEVSITLNDVSITGLDANQSPLLLNDGAIVNLNIEGENILTAESNFAGIQAPEGTTLTIDGSGSLTANGGHDGAGMGGGGMGSNGGNGGNITIIGVTVTAIGGYNAAGIGGGGMSGDGTGGNGGNISIIGGTVTAIGGAHAAGIGVGRHFTGDEFKGGTIIINSGNVWAYGLSTQYDAGAGISGSSITITGGYVVARGGSSSGFGNSGINGESITITGGTVEASGGSFDYPAGISGAITINGGTVIASGIGAPIMDGNAVVFVSRMNVIDDTQINSGILFIGYSGVLYGNVELEIDMEIPRGHILTIKEDTNFTVLHERILTNNGTAVNYGTINVNGLWVGNPYIDGYTTTPNNIIDFDKPMPTGIGWTLEDKVFTVTGDVLITGTAIDGRRIEIAENANVNITLNDVSIISYAPLLLKNGAIVNLVIEGVNTLTEEGCIPGIQGGCGAGILVPQGTTITIGGTGSLTTTGTTGIGSGTGRAGYIGNTIQSVGYPSGSITINSGIITATGRSGAGIGGSSGFFGGGDGGIITINGGTISAIGNVGIGGGTSNYLGSGGSGGMITINGGTITAVGEAGAGIGGGGGGTTYGGYGGIININGGTIVAVGNNGSGIGGGRGSEYSLYNDTDMYNGGFGGNIVITGGTVTATSSTCAGIGSGSSGNEVSIPDDYWDNLDEWEDLGDWDGWELLTMNGNAIVFASSITDDSPKTNGILFIGDNPDGIFYGNSITITDDVTIPEEKILTISVGKTFTIPAGVTLINNGTIINNGTLTNNGRLINNGTIIGAIVNVQPLSYIDLSDDTPPASGYGWTYENNIYTLANGATVIIEGESKNNRRVVVAENAKNVSITLKDVTITGLGNEQSPLLLNSDAEVKLTLEGVNTLAAGVSRAGIQTTNATLVIDGSGILNVTGGNTGAGIGGGWSGAGGNVTVSGGAVWATGGTNAIGIGSGGGSNNSGTFTMNGSAIVFASSVGDMDEDTKTDGILVIGDATHWYADDDFTLSGDLTIPSNYTLTIDVGKTFTIPSGMTLTNNGTVRHCSAINSGGVYGVWAGNEPVPLGGNTIDLSISDPLPCGEGWLFNDVSNVYTINNGATVTITGESANNRRIEVAANAKNVNITLNNVTITDPGFEQSSMLLNAGAEVTLRIDGVNTLSSGVGSAGIQTDGATLVVEGSGNLTVTGGDYGAGIGGGINGSGGSVAINGGSVTAAGGQYGGAGIGGGYLGAAGVFEMNGNAVVFASSISDTDESKRTGGILFTVGNSNGIFYGNSVEITADALIPAGYTLIVAAGKTLTIPAGKTLTNNGVMVDNGTINIFGSFAGNRILFENAGAGDDEITYVPAAIDVSYLFTINQNAGAYICTIESGSTGVGTFNGSNLTVAKSGVFIIGLETAVTDYYTAGAKVFSTLTVAKAPPVYTTPANLTAYYGAQLSSVDLPELWTWETPAIAVGAAGTQTHKATFTPADTDNYNVITGIDLTLSVAKASPPVTFPSMATLTYGDALADAVFEGEIGAGTFAFTDLELKPTVANSDKEYEMTFTPSDSDNYTIARQNVAIIVLKALPVYTTPANLTSYYGAALSSVELPEGWTWESSSNAVGAAGVQTHKAIFTPADTDNYNVITGIDVSVAVAKASPPVTFPAMATLTYGEPLALAMFEGEAGAGTFAFSDSEFKPSVADSDNEYEMTFTPYDANNYNVARQNVKIIVSKATPAYTAPENLTAYFSYLLSSIELPEKWTWETPENTVGEVGDQTHMATFTPDDTNNYHIVTGIEVTIYVLPYIHVTSVRFDAFYVYIAIGESRKLNAIIEPEDALNKNLVWRNSYSSIATIDSEGVITGLSVGHTNIVVITDDGDFRAECVVYVLATSSEEDSFIPELNIVPNPFTDVVRIVGAVAVETRHATSVRQQIPIQMRIVNAAGVIVHTQMINSHDETINLEHLPAGVYLFSFEKDGQTKTVRVVKN